LVEDWLNSHARWIEVLTGADLQPSLGGKPVGASRLHMPAVGTTDSGDVLDFAYGYLQPTPSVGYERYRVTLPQWTAAAHRVNKGEQPDSAHLFLRDARAALHRHDFRRAVVDACTAAEVALAGSIRRSHPQARTKPDDVSQAVKNAGGVVRLFEIQQAIWRSPA
jgi:hypothetical protein